MRSEKSLRVAVGDEAAHVGGTGRGLRRRRRVRSRRGAGVALNLRSMTILRAASVGEPGGEGGVEFRSMLRCRPRGWCSCW